MLKLSYDEFISDYGCFSYLEVQNSLD